MKKFLTTLLIFVVAITMSTKAFAQTTVMFEDFESGSFPQGWTMSTVFDEDFEVTDYNWTGGGPGGAAYVYPYNGSSYALYCCTDGTGGKKTFWVKTAEINLTDYKSAEFDFYYVNYGSGMNLEGEPAINILQVQASKTKNGTYTTLWEEQVDHQSWTNKKVDLSNYAGGKVFLKINVTQIDKFTYSMCSVFDNLKVTASADDPTPVEYYTVTVKQTTGGTVKANPTTNLREGDYVAIQAYHDGEEGDDDAYIFMNWIIKDEDNNTITPESEEYLSSFKMPASNVTVEAWFHLGPVKPHEFDFFYEDFDDYDEEVFGWDLDLRQGWSTTHNADAPWVVDIYNWSGDPAPWSPTGHKVFAHSSPYAVYHCEIEDEYIGKTDYLYAPQLDFTGKTSAVFTFWAWSENDRYFDSDLEQELDHIDDISVVISTSKTGPWTTLWSNNGQAINEWTKYTIDMTDYLGGKYYIAFVSTIRLGWGAAFDNMEIVVSEEVIEKPGKATNPYPANNATEISPAVTMTWTDGEQAAQYQVKMGTSTTNLQVVVDWATKLENPSYTPTGLANGTTYYWQVNEKNSAGSTTGDVWKFTTTASTPATNLVLSNPEIMSGEKFNLSWTAPASKAGLAGYFVYKNGTKVNTTPIAQTSTQVGDCGYNMNPGYTFYVTAAYGSAGSYTESPKTNEVVGKVSGEGSIKTNVYERDGSTPIAQATLTVKGVDEFGKEVTKTAQSAANGSINVAVPAGTYNVAYVSKDGYQSNFYANDIVVAYNKAKTIENFNLYEEYVPVTQVIAEQDGSNANIKWSFALMEDMFDGFESGDFNNFNWLNGYSEDSEVLTFGICNDANVYEGNYCAKSVNSGLKGTQSLLSVSTYYSRETTMTFYAKTDYAKTDIAAFYIDGQSSLVITGEKSWKKYEFQIQPGYHTFTWISNNTTGGQGSFYIDNVTLMVKKTKDVEETRSFSKYNLFRKSNNGAESSAELIATLNEQTYVDDMSALESGFYHYGVQAVYAGNRGYQDIEVNDFEFGLKDWTITSGSSTGFYLANQSYDLQNAYQGAYSLWSDCNGTLGVDKLTSPSINLANVKLANLAFSYVSNEWEGDVNTLYVHVSVNGGAFTEIWNNNSMSSDGWQNISLNFDEYVGKTIQIRFTAGDNYGHAVGLDNIRLYGLVPGQGDASGNSRIIWSNLIAKNMNANVNIVVTTNSGDSPKGTVVDLVYKQAPQTGLDLHAVLDETGTYTFENVVKGEYLVTFALDGFESCYEGDVVDVQSDYLLECEMTESIKEITDLVVTPQGMAMWNSNGDEFFEQLNGATLPAGWTTIDADGDGFTWEHSSYPGHTATNGCYTSASYINDFDPLHPNNYLVTPQVKIGLTSILSFWAQAQDEKYPAEHFGVAVGTNPDDASSFTTIWATDLEAKRSGAWHQYSVDLAAYAGQKVYLAIRHFDCTDNYMINVSDVRLSNGAVNTRQFLGYTVELDGEIVGSTKNTTFFHNTTDLVEGIEYTTTVYGVYTTGNSNELSYTWTYQACNGSTEVYNLQGIAEDQDVVLTWNNPEETVKKLQIFRDDQLLQNLEAGTTTFTDVNVPAGTHVYKVIVVNLDDSTSCGVEVQVEVSMLCTAPKDLYGHSATVDGVGGAELIWPLFQEWIGYDNGTAASVIGAGGVLYWGIKFPDMRKYDGSSLQAVRFFPAAATEYVLNIYEGGNNAPGDLIYTQVINTTEDQVGDWLDVELTNALTIDGNESLWITFYNDKCTHPATVCNNTGDPNGRWVSVDGEEWIDITTASASMNYTFMMSAYVTNFRGSQEPVALEPFQGEQGTADFSEQAINFTPRYSTLAYYNIYRCTDGYSYELVGQADGKATKYFDAVPDGTYYYRVTAVYQEGNEVCESDYANSYFTPEENFVVVEVTASGIEENNADGISIYPNPTKNNLYISGEGLNRITITSVMGQVLYDQAIDKDQEIVDMSQFGSGVYTVRIATAEGVRVECVTVTK